MGQQNRVVEKTEKSGLMAALVGWALGTLRMMSSGVGTNRFLSSSWPWLHPLPTVGALGSPSLCSEILGGLWTLFLWHQLPNCKHHPPTINSSLALE